MSTLDDCISARLVFDPATARQTFRLHATEVVETTLLPELARLQNHQAPQTNLEVAFSNRQEVPLALVGHALIPGDCFQLRKLTRA